MTFNLIKKWIIVPYKENNPEKEKIQRILNNKSINIQDKLKLISNIIISNNQNKNDIFRTDEKVYTQFQENDKINQNINTGTGPGADSELFNQDTNNPTEFESELNGNPSILEGHDKIRKENENFEFKDLDRTFKNLYDYYPPAEQTRSKSDPDLSFLTLSKALNRIKKRPQTPERLKQGAVTERAIKRKNIDKIKIQTKKQKLAETKLDLKQKERKYNLIKLKKVNKEIPILSKLEPEINFLPKNNSTNPIFGQQNVLNAPKKKLKLIKWTKYTNSITSPKKKLF